MTPLQGCFARRARRGIGARRHRGVSLVETVVTLPVLLLLIGGVYEYVRLEQTRVTVKHAALLAAREGAVGRASGEALHRGLARGLAPLYGAAAVRDRTSTTTCSLFGLICETEQDPLQEAARKHALRDVERGFSEAAILNPTRELFDALKVDSGPAYNGRAYLPNAGQQRMSMNSAIPQGTQTHNKTYEVVRYRSEVTLEQFVEWLHGNGRVVGLEWDRQVPVLSVVEPSYQPGACNCDFWDLHGHGGGTDGWCGEIKGSCGAADGVAGDWEHVNDANGDEHETDVDDLEALARFAWRADGGAMDATEIVGVIGLLKAQVEKIRQNESKCFALEVNGDCWGIEKNDTDGPEVYEQAWLNYLDHMLLGLPNLSAPYRTTITKSIDFESHSQTARGTIQDANLLKVLVIHGYDPVVPLPWLRHVMGDDGTFHESYDGIAGRINDGWADEYQGPTSGQGFGLIRDAARRIRAAGRVPIMATATVRMQSPVEKSRHMLSSASDYFRYTLAPPGNATIPGFGAAFSTGFNNPFSDPGVAPQGDYSMEQCLAMDLTLRHATAYDIRKPGTDAYIGINDGHGSVQSLLAMGLWPSDQSDRHDLVVDMRFECQSYVMENTEYDYSGTGLLEGLDDEQTQRVSEGQLEPEAWYVPPAYGAIVYQHRDYQGWAVELEPGCYDLEQLEQMGFQNDNMSSFRVEDAFSITLFEHDERKGDSNKYTDDTTYIGDEDNDTVSSICVSRE